MTIRGYYRRSRDDQPPAPHASAWLAIPSLEWVGEVEFLLDTGADATTLLPGAIDSLGINTTAVMSPVVRVHGAGGGVSCKSVEAVVSLLDAAIGGFRGFPVNLVLIEGEPAQADGPHEPLSAVIGRDILNLCECTFNAATGRVTLEPL